MAGKTPPEVLFETLTSLHRPLVSWYLWRGCRVSVFDFGCQLKSMAWLKRLINTGRVQRIYVHPNAEPHSLALEAAERLSPRFAEHPLIRSLSRLFGAEEAAPVFKKALLDDVFPCVFVWVTLRARTADGRSATLIPDTYGAWQRALAGWGLPPLARVRIPRMPAFWSSCVGAIARLRMTLALGLASTTLAVKVWLATRSRQAGGSDPASQATYLYAIDQPFQTKFQGKRQFDFLLDGRWLTRENTAFVVHPSAEGPWVEHARAAGYRLIQRRTLTTWSSVRRAPPRRADVRHALATLARVGAGISGPSWILQTAIVGVVVLLEEALLCARVAASHYLYTNQDDRVQRWRNVVLRSRGLQTWYFALSIGGGYLYGDRMGTPGTTGCGDRHRLWAYQNPDHFVAQSQRMIAYYQQHRQRVGAYHNVGNIWSELVRLAGSSARHVLAGRWEAERGRGGKVVSWFDTTFIEADNSPSTYREAIAWYTDILRLLADEDDLLMVIKPSKADGYFTDPDAQWSHPLGTRLMDVWAELRRHPRVWFAGHDGDPASLIAASDLTVTFCFSSVTAEALGARKRAIWYEPGARWRETLYGADLRLTAHGYDELRALVRSLLDRMTEERYNTYLEAHVRGIVEDWLDGQGLTRFRALLGTAMPPATDPLTTRREPAVASWPSDSPAYAT